MGDVVGAFGDIGRALIDPIGVIPRALIRSADRAFWYGSGLLRGRGAPPRRPWAE
jgi:hypothetical protein